MVEPPTANDVNSLTAERQDDIKKILSTIISTSIDKEYTNGQALTQADLDNKIVLSVSKLDGKQQTAADNPSNNIPIWVYIVGGVLLLAIIALIILLVRKRRRDEEEEFEFDERTPIDVPDIDTEPETEEMVRKNQLEKWQKKTRRLLLNCYAAGCPRIRRNTHVEKRSKSTNRQTKSSNPNDFLRARRVSICIQTSV